MNRLGASSSLYLRQHAENPIDWYPWGVEAFNEARRRDVPVFVSVGYSSCHWCHVMAAESFSDARLASSLNRSFVAVKVDRDEHPDVDDVLITACQIANGHAGWPLSVFMTPDQEPFFVGTYFPLEARGDNPGFRKIVESLAHSWKSERDELLGAAAEFSTAIRQVLSRPVPASSGKSVVDMARTAVKALYAEFDHENGGFGGAPKFPPYPALFFLRTVIGCDLLVDVRSQAEEMLAKTLEGMVNGGIYDHVGQGFHRYSTDSTWHLPHFEKMLGDNAMATIFFIQAGNWVLYSMEMPDGTFASTMDAGAEGIEGAPYVWSKAEISSLLGDKTEDFCKAFGVLAEGNFHEESTGRMTGLNVLHRHELRDFSKELRLLEKARNSKPQPERDEKVVASLNGMAAWSFTTSGFDGLSSYACIDTWYNNSRHGMPHQMVDGKGSGLPYLDDLAWMSLAAMNWLDYHQDWSRQLIEQALLEHENPAGGFFLSSLKHESPLGRQVPILDGPTPSANSVILEVLFKQGRTDVAMHHLTKLLGWAERLPTACLGLLDVALRYAPEAISAANKPVEVSVRMEPDHLVIGDDGFAHTVLRVQVPEGHHINSYDPPATWLTPTSMKVDGALGEAGFPQGSEDYVGLVEIPLRLVRKGESGVFTVALTYQLCNETECFTPQTASVSGVITGRLEG